MKNIMKTVRMSEEMMETINTIMCKKGQNFTEFAIEAMENYIRGIKFTEKVEQSFGIWGKNEHQELDNGTDRYVRNMRKGRKL